MNGHNFFSLHFPNRHLEILHIIMNIHIFRIKNSNIFGKDYKSVIAKTILQTQCVIEVEILKKYEVETIF